jgi:hypothetical protein
METKAKAKAKTDGDGATVCLRGKLSYNYST